MTLRAGLRRLDERLGYPLTAMMENRREKDRMAELDRHRQARQQRYASSSAPSRETRVLVDQLNRDGFAILRQAVPPSRVLPLRDQLERRLDSGELLIPVSDDAARKAGDRAAATKFLTAEEMGKGQEYLRAHTNYAAVAEPLLNCPATIPLAFDQQLIDIAAGYLECVPAIGGINLRKSFRNDLPEFDTLFFHVDPNSPRFLKFFYYLNDVDERGGPFCYVRGSHHRRFPGWQRKYRWALEEIAPVYGADNVLLLTAKVGDIIVADTNGFHRGTKITGQDRGMLTVDYVLHPETGGPEDEFKIRRKDVEALSASQRPAADFLTLVD
ncbi:MAG TPA: phytanoyl-CoA dioxygenase family protein [Gemmatimonadaceae bacterium]|nr:phytanoyl-CoA dioxygenase family protein [Gemmatimonadaceae bacterium]